MATDREVGTGHIIGSHLSFGDPVETDHFRDKTIEVTNALFDMLIDKYPEVAIDVSASALISTIASIGIGLDPKMPLEKHNRDLMAMALQVLVNRLRSDEFYSRVEEKPVDGL